MSWPKLYTFEENIDYYIKKNDKEYCIIPRCYKTCACFIFLFLIEDRKSFKLLMDNNEELIPENEIQIKTINSFNFKKFIYGNYEVLSNFLKTMIFYELDDIKIQRNYFVNVFDNEEWDSIDKIKAHVSQECKKLYKSKY